MWLSLLTRNSLFGLLICGYWLILFNGFDRLIRNNWLNFLFSLLDFWIVCNLFGFLDWFGLRILMSWFCLLLWLCLLTNNSCFGLWTSHNWFIWLVFYNWWTLLILNGWFALLLWCWFCLCENRLCLLSRICWLCLLIDRFIFLFRDWFRLLTWHSCRLGIFFGRLYTRLRLFHRFQRSTLIFQMKLAWFLLLILNFCIILFWFFRVSNLSINLLLSLLLCNLFLRRSLSFLNRLCSQSFSLFLFCFNL